MNILREHQKSSGFTLIEVLVGMTIFLIGLLSVYGLQVSAYVSVSELNKKNKAAFFANTYQEIITLEQSYSQDLSVFKKNWNLDLKNEIPDITIRFPEDKNSKYSLELFWPSRLSVPHCQDKIDEETDCIRI